MFHRFTHLQPDRDDKLQIILLATCAANASITAGTPPPIRNGLIGWYTGHSMDVPSLTWQDLSGNNNHARVLSDTSTVAVTTAAQESATYLFGQPVVTGNTSSRVLWPTSVLPAVYTLFHVARWNGPSRGRSEWC